MAKRPFLLLYINDFLSAPTVAVMDNDQFAWYLRLLMHAWQNEPACCLPNEDYLLMTWAGVRDKPEEVANWESKKKLVLCNWDVDETGVWLKNARLLKEYDKMLETTEKRQEAGRLGAERKWQKDGNAMAVPSEPMAKDGNTEVRSQKSEEKDKPAPLALPDWLPLPQWHAFLEVRKRKKAANTDYALGLVIGRLTEYRNKGQPPDKVLEMAIQSAWTTVWPLKDGNHHQQPETKMKSAADVLKDRKK